MSLPSPIVVYKATPRAPNIILNWYMQPIYGRTDRSSSKTMSTSDVLKKNVVGNKTQFWVVFIVGHIDQLPFFIVGHLDQLFLFILGHLDQLILFIVGHFDQLRLLDGSSTVTIACSL